MSRDIKFRAWYKTVNKMVSVDLMCFDEFLAENVVANSESI